MRSYERLVAAGARPAYRLCDPDRGSPPRLGGERSARAMAAAVPSAVVVQGVLLLLGVHLEVRGRPTAVEPALFVPNHVSYLDIPILGALCDAAFIAKAEIADWPFFGWLARKSGTLFVRRHWREAKRQRDALAARLARTESFVLFAEGTSSPGLDVLPLKTSLLSVAEPNVVDRPIAVQPVVLAYRRLRRGPPIDAHNAELYAWCGDATLLPHLWRVLQLPGSRWCFGSASPSSPGR